MKSAAFTSFIMEYRHRRSSVMHFDALWYSLVMAVSSTKRRTTVTLPVATLRSAKRLANRRNVHLNVIMNEAIEGGLRQQLAVERAEDFVERMGRAFAGLAEEELLMVNGIYLTGKK